MNTKARISSFDFARALCTVGIIYFHYTEASACEALSMNLGHLEAGWGYLFVTVFFMISGALMYYQHEEIDDILTFYKRRWSSIFPSFYMAYIPIFIIRVFRSGKVFYMGRPWTLILSFFGLDGYLSKSIPDYYLVGEWFLGAILIMYLLYPIVVRFFKRSTTITWCMVLVLFFICRNRRMWAVSPLANVFSCMVSFVGGMLIMRYRLYRSSIMAGLSVFVLAVIQFMDLSIVNPNILMHIAGFALFFVVIRIGELLTVSRRFARGSELICGITYEVYLIHHVVIINMLQTHNPDRVSEAMLMLMLCNLIIIPMAWGLKYAASIMRNRFSVTQ